MANGFVTPTPPVDFDPGFVQAPPATAPEQTQTFGTSFTEKPQFFGAAGTPTGGFAGSLAPLGPGQSAASTVPSIGVSDVDSDIDLGGVAAAGAGLAGLGALIGSLGQEENGGVGSMLSPDNIISGASKFLDLGELTGNVGETAINKLRDFGFDDIANKLDLEFGIDSTFMPGSDAGQAFLKGPVEGIPEFPMPDSTGGPIYDPYMEQFSDVGMTSTAPADMASLATASPAEAMALANQAISQGVGTTSLYAPTTAGMGSIPSVAAPTTVAPVGYGPTAAASEIAAITAAPAAAAPAATVAPVSGAGSAAASEIAAMTAGIPTTGAVLSAPAAAVAYGGGPMIPAAGLGAAAAGATAASTAAAATAAANLSMGIGGAMTGGSLAGAAPIVGMAGLLGPAAVIALPLLGMMMSDDDPTAAARGAQQLENDLQNISNKTGEDKEAAFKDLEEKIWDNPDTLKLINRAAFNPDLPFGTKATSGGTGVIELSPNIKKVVAENQERLQNVIKEKEKVMKQVEPDVRVEATYRPVNPYRKPTIQIDEAAIAAGMMDDPRKKKKKKKAKQDSFAVGAVTV